MDHFVAVTTCINNTPSEYISKTNNTITKTNDFIEDAMDTTSVLSSPMKATMRVKHNIRANRRMPTLRRTLTVGRCLEPVLQKVVTVKSPVLIVKMIQSNQFTNHPVR